MLMMMMIAGINLQSGYAQEELMILTFGDSITAGLIQSIDDDTSSECHSGVSLAPSLSGSGNLRCFGFGAEGVGGYQPGLKQLAEELGYEVLIYNYGYSGITTAGMTSEISGDLTEQFLSQYVLLMGGANDVFDGVNPSTVKFNLQSMVNTICAFEMFPVLATVTQNLQSSSFNSLVSDYNDEIRDIDTGSSNCEVIPAEQNGALRSGNDFGFDGLHLTTQGNDKMANEWFAAMALPSVLFNGDFLPAVIELLLGD